MKFHPLGISLLPVNEQVGMIFSDPVSLRPCTSMKEYVNNMGKGNSKKDS